MDLNQIAEKWQEQRNKHQIYKVVEDPKKPKFYILDMFPYPSGAGLHVGHPKWYIATDVIARKKTLQGFNVLHPMGFDTFGLGTEQYAIEKKMKPQVVAQQNIDNFKRQLKMFGLTYDRDRSFSTADPDYYKRTQRIFLQLYNHYYDEKLKKARPISELEKKLRSWDLSSIIYNLSSPLSESDLQNILYHERLAYVDFKPINRCPKCMTGLANEDLADGKCERCGTIVEQRPMKQRVLRITKYAERLLEWLDKLQWDEAMRDLERNRIGKSEGTEFKMQVQIPENTPENLRESKKEYKDWSYDIIGLAMKVHSALGPGLQEKIYKNALKKVLEKNWFKVEEEKKIEYKIDGEKVGYWLIDLLVNDTIAIELKSRKILEWDFYKQLRTYIQQWETIKTWFLLNFYNWKLEYKRLEKDYFNSKKSPGILSNSQGNSQGLSFEVYTTRIDTVYGMSFVVMAPEHELVDQITIKEYKKAVEKYKDEAKHKSQLERTELQKDKSGQFTGAYAINPFNAGKVPIFIADYVLAWYGTGVVMAVPAHDERDFEFAKKYDLPITQSIAPKNKRKALIIHGFEGSAKWNRLPRLTKKLEEQNIEVINETLPNPAHPDFEESMKFLKPHFDKLDESSLLIGHSLWGKFALKLLEQSKKQVGTTILVAPTTNMEKDWEALKKDTEREWSDIDSLKAMYEIPLDLKKINTNCTNKILLLSKDDPYISIDTWKSLDNKRTEIILENKGHFQDTEDEDLLKIVLNNLACYTQKWILVNSWDFTWLKSDKAITEMQKRLEKNKIGWKQINYKMQDRVFSRQRYRGEPFPILRISNEWKVTSNEKKKNSWLITSNSSLKALPMDEADLPLVLPDVENYEPTGTTEWPLANIDERVNITLPDWTKAKRETNTMPGRAGSSRYRLRYMDPKNNKELVSKEREKYRGEVDVYVGGAEHVTRHMIYARFWQKFLYDLGIVTHDEPFKEYHYVGLIMAEDGRKMSKRRWNTIDPDKVISEFGHDTFRVYEMFMGPFDQAIARSTNGVKWAKKFLDKIITLSHKVQSMPRNGVGPKSIKSDWPSTLQTWWPSTSWTTNQTMSTETLTLLNQTIKKLGDDIDGFKFNTCISQLMILVNHLTELPSIDKKTFETLTILISPFAPHLAEELRSELGNKFSIFTKAKWPSYDEKCLSSATIKIWVQFNGKVRGDICISKEATQDEVMAIVKADAKLNARLTSEPKKIIYVPGKILNIVI